MGGALVAGYDGEHLVHLADSTVTTLATCTTHCPPPCVTALSSCPESDETAATIVYTQLARMFLDGALDAQTVGHTASTVLA
jgi:hypothetical protein